jgi:hypothetical protein
LSSVRVSRILKCQFTAGPFLFWIRPTSYYCFHCLNAAGPCD